MSLTRVLVISVGVMLWQSNSCLSSNWISGLNGENLGVHFSRGAQCMFRGYIYMYTRGYKYQIPLK